MVQRLPLRVLVVEDSPGDAALLLYELRRGGYEPVGARVETAEEMQAALAQGPWDLVLSDYHLPRFRTEDALRMVRGSGLDVPFIVVSGTADEEAAITAMRTGVNDYLTKDNLTRLVPTVERELRETENRRAHRQAEQAAFRLAAIVESSEDAIIGKTLDGIITDWNPGAERVYGWSAAEAVGQSISLIIPPDHPEELAAILEGVRRGERVRNWETVRRRKDGTRIDVAVSIAPVRDATGQVVGASVTGRDVTDRKRAEEALRRSEERYRALAESIPQLVWITGPNGETEYRNQRWAEYTDSWPDDKGSWFWQQLLHPEDHARTHQAWTATLQSGQPFEIEYRLRRADGVYRWHIARGVPVRDAAGQIVEWFGTCTDIDDQKRAEEAVRASESRFRAVVEKSFDAVTLVAADQTFRYVSPSFGRILGYTPEAVLGKSSLDFLHPDDVPALLELSAGFLQTPGGTVSCTYRGRHKDGSYRWLEARATNLLAEPGVQAIVTNVRDVSERKRAEEALARDALLLANVRDSVIVTDLDLVVTYWNEGATRLFGWTAREMLGRPVFDRLPAQARQAATASMQSIRAGAEWSGEWEDFRKDGSRVWVESRASLLRDPGGQVVGILGISHDISDRKRAEAALRESEASLRQAFRAAGMVGWSYDPKTNRLTRSENAAELLGFPAEQTAQEGWSLVLPEDLPGHQARVREALDARRPYKSMFRYRRSDTGEVRWLEDHGQGEWDDKGTFLRLAGVLLDVTERQRAEEALQLRDRAVQAVTQGILITDPNQPDNPIVYASPGFERLTGYSQAESQGRNCRFLQGKDTDPDAVARVGLAIREGRPCTVELLNYKKDGTPFWNELSISPIRDAAGRLTHFVGVLADVTERRRLEEQYRQSQKMEAIGTLAGGVAHDFNNLLTIINGYSDMLLQTLPAGDPTRSLLEEIRKAGERSASLTRQLLAFSRQQVLTPKVLDLNAVIADLEKMLRRIIGEDVSLTTSLAPGLGAVKADPGQMEQVIMNLAVNGRDAMPQGGQLTIETRNVGFDDRQAQTHAGAHPGAYVLLAVSDTGCGMTPEVRTRIFEPFFTTKGPTKGTGLGLAVVHGVVQQSGGFIEVYSEPGVGTTFKVYLPRVGEAGPTESASPRVKAAPMGTETVLLVEDEEAVRGLTRHVLSGHGYTILEASDGEEALRVAGQHHGPIHLLVSDVVMPGMSGRVLAERVLALHPAARVLFVSGYTDDAVVRHGILEQQVQFLQKPFSPVALAEKVRDVLDSAS